MAPQLVKALLFLAGIQILTAARAEALGALPAETPAMQCEKGEETCVSETDSDTRASVTMMTWNVCGFDCDGGANAGGLTRVAAFLRDTQKSGGLDVVALNELNGLDDETLADLANQSGFAYSVLMRVPSGYHLGILSRENLTEVERHTAPFHHGLLEACSFGVHWLVTHLSPVDSVARLLETKAIAARIHALTSTPQSVPVVLLGDLNTLSPQDDLGDLAQLLDKDPRLRRKFLVPHRPGTAPRVDIRPLQSLLDAGLQDMAPNGSATVPTHVRTDPMHAFDMRLDYALYVGEKLAARAPAEAMRDARTALLSDHYPVRGALWTGASDQASRSGLA